MGVAMEQLVVILLAASVAAQDYGPVSLDSVDALTLNWNQIQWLVKDQIKEVEELREEHNERTVDDGQEDQGRPGQTCCSRRGAGSCRSQESLLVLILVLLVLIILAWLWRWTSSGSNVLWSQLSNEQQRQWPALLQCQHHLRPNPYCL